VLGLDDRVKLGRFFKIPAGAFALPADKLVPAGLASPAEVLDARRDMGDPGGGNKRAPLVVHPSEDGGRFIVTGGAASLAAGLERGLGRFPVVLGPVAGVDTKLRSAKGPVRDGLGRARELLMRGGGAADVAREALARPDVKDRASGYQRGLRAGFHAATDSGLAGSSLGVASPSLFGHEWSFGKGKKEPVAPWLEEQAKEWAGPAPAKAKEPVQDDAKVVKLTKPAGGSNGAMLAEDVEGTRWIVKNYKGNQDRVATELLANALYRELGIDVPEAGTLSFGGKPALAYPLVEGTPGGGKLRVGGPNRELAKGFMADAYLANWDVVGLDHDNLLWPEGTEKVDADTKPVRLDQGGSLQYRAMGSTKAFGPVPSEVWTMAGPGGQGFGTMALTPEVKRQGAAEIAKLSDARIEALADAAGFASGKMRDEVVEALKARRDWMAAYAKGEVHEPRPAEGDAARAALTGGQAKLELFPEQEAALAGWGAWSGQVNLHLRSNLPKEAASKEVRFLVREMDSLLGHVKTTSDAAVHFSLPDRAEPDGGWEALAGRTLKEPGYVGAAVDRARADREGAATVKLTLPTGSRALYLHGVPGQDSPEALPAQPEVVLARGARMVVTHVEVDGKRPVIHATLAR
jgi:hypothetical protein